VFNGGLLAAFLKCMAAFNHHGTRNIRINKDDSMSVCLRCVTQEDWEYIITYPMLRSK